MNTSACGTVRYPHSPSFWTETDLVNQNDRLPRCGDIKGAVQGLIDLRSRNTQVTSSDYVQWLANVFGRGLGGQRLSTAGRTEKIDDETLSFSLNEIVESEVLIVGLYKGLEQLLSPSGKHKVRERFIVPFDIGNLLDVELDC